jgi:hypothetical protein
MPQATSSVIYFPKQSKPAGTKHPKEQCSVLEWVRNGYTFPGKKPKPLPSPGLPPSSPNPLPPISTPPSPNPPPRKPGEKGGAR